MRFARRNRFALIVIAVLLIGNVLALQQFWVNGSLHRQLREDLILLHDKGHIKEAERVYQKLVPSLPRLPDGALIDDLARTAGLVNEKTLQLDNIVWKYHWAVKQNLEKRSEQRLARAMKRAEQE